MSTQRKYIYVIVGLNLKMNDVIFSLNSNWKIGRLTGKLQAVFEDLWKMGRLVLSDAEIMNLLLENFEVDALTRLLNTLLNPDYLDEDSPIYFDEGEQYYKCRFCDYNSRNRADYPKGHWQTCPVYLAYLLEEVLIRIDEDSKFIK